MCRHKGHNTDQINIGLVKKYYSIGDIIGGFRCVISIEDVLSN